MLNISIIFIVFLFIFNYNLTGKLNYFTPENILRFANFLYNEKEFEYAISEYKRYLYLFPDLPDNTDLIYYKIGTSYLHLKKFNNSIFYFNTIISNYPSSIYTSKSFYNIAYSYFMQKKYKNSIGYIESNINNITDTSVKKKINMLKIVNYIYMKKFNKAEQEWNKLNNLEKNKNFVTLKEIIDSSKRIKKKNRVLSGVLSTIIPGAGKIYCNRTLDGIFSFVVIGLLAYQSYDGFKKDGIESVKGWIGASIGCALYIGNIYGSIVAVNVYNFQQEKNFFKNVDKKIKYILTPDY